MAATYAIVGSVSEEQLEIVVTDNGAHHMFRAKFTADGVPADFSTEALPTATLVNVASPGTTLVLTAAQVPAAADDLRFALTVDPTGGQPNAGVNPADLVAGRYRVRLAFAGNTIEYVQKGQADYTVDMWHSATKTAIADSPTYSDFEGYTEGNFSNANRTRTLSPNVEQTLTALEQGLMSVNSGVANTVDFGFGYGTRVRGLYKAAARNPDSRSNFYPVMNLYHFHVVGVDCGISVNDAPWEIYFLVKVRVPGTSGTIRDFSNFDLGSPTTTIHPPYDPAPTAEFYIDLLTQGLVDMADSTLPLQRHHLKTVTEFQMMVRPTSPSTTGNATFYVSNLGLVRAVRGSLHDPLSLKTNVGVGTLETPGDVVPSGSTRQTSATSGTVHSLAYLGSVLHLANGTTGQSATAAFDWNWPANENLKTDASHDSVEVGLWDLFNIAGTGASLACRYQNAAGTTFSRSFPFPRDGSNNLYGGNFRFYTGRNVDELDVVTAFGANGTAGLQVTSMTSYRTYGLVNGEDVSVDDLAQADAASDVEVVNESLPLTTGAAYEVARVRLLSASRKPFLNFNSDWIYLDRVEFRNAGGTVTMPLYFEVGSTPDRLAIWSNQAGPVTPGVYRVVVVPNEGPEIFVKTDGGSGSTLLEVAVDTPAVAQEGGPGSYAVTSASPFVDLSPSSGTIELLRARLVNTAGGGSRPLNFSVAPWDAAFSGATVEVLRSDGSTVDVADVRPVSEALGDGTVVVRLDVGASGGIPVGAKRCRITLAAPAAAQAIDPVRSGTDPFEFVIAKTSFSARVKPSTLVATASLVDPFLLATEYELFRCEVQRNLAAVEAGNPALWDDHDFAAEGVPTLAKVDLLRDDLPDFEVSGTVVSGATVVASANSSAFPGVYTGASHTARLRLQGPVSSLPGPGGATFSLSEGPVVYSGNSNDYTVLLKPEVVDSRALGDPLASVSVGTYPPGSVDGGWDLEVTSSAHAVDNYLNGNSEGLQVGFSAAGQEYTRLLCAPNAEPIELGDDDENEAELLIETDEVTPGGAQLQFRMSSSTNASDPWTSGTFYTNTVALASNASTKIRIQNENLRRTRFVETKVVSTSASAVQAQIRRLQMRNPKSWATFEDTLTDAQTSGGTLTEASLPSVVGRDGITRTVQPAGPQPEVAATVQRGRLFAKADPNNLLNPSKLKYTFSTPLLLANNENAMRVKVQNPLAQFGGGADVSSGTHTLKAVTTTSSDAVVESSVQVFSSGSNPSAAVLYTGPDIKQVEFQVTSTDPSSAFIISNVESFTSPPGTYSQAAGSDPAVVDLALLFPAGTKASGTLRLLTVPLSYSNALLVGSVVPDFATGDHVENLAKATARLDALDAQSSTLSVPLTVTSNGSAQGSVDLWLDADSVAAEAGLYSCRLEFPTNTLDPLQSSGSDLSVLLRLPRFGTRVAEVAEVVPSGGTVLDFEIGSSRVLATGTLQRDVSVTQVAGWALFDAPNEVPAETLDAVFSRPAVLGDVPWTSADVPSFANEARVTVSANSATVPGPFFGLDDPDGYYSLALGWRGSSPARYSTPWAASPPPQYADLGLVELGTPVLTGALGAYTVLLAPPTSQPSASLSNVFSTVNAGSYAAPVPGVEGGWEFLEIEASGGAAAGHHLGGGTSGLDLDFVAFGGQYTQTLTSANQSLELGDGGALSLTAAANAVEGDVSWVVRVYSEANTEASEPVLVSDPVLLAADASTTVTLQGGVLSAAKALSWTLTGQTVGGSSAQLASVSAFTSEVWSSFQDPFSAEQEPDTTTTSVGSDAFPADGSVASRQLSGSTCAVRGGRLTVGSLTAGEARQGSATWTFSPALTMQNGENALRLVFTAANGDAGADTSDGQTYTARATAVQSSGGASAPVRSLVATVSASSSSQEAVLLFVGTGPIESVTLDLTASANAALFLSSVSTLGGGADPTVLWAQDGQLRNPTTNALLSSAPVPLVNVAAGSSYPLFRMPLRKTSVPSGASTAVDFVSQSDPNADFFEIRSAVLKKAGEADLPLQWAAASSGSVDFTLALEHGDPRPALGIWTALVTLDNEVAPSGFSASVSQTEFQYAQAEDASGLALSTVAAAKNAAADTVTILSEFSVANGAYDGATLEIAAGPNAGKSAAVLSTSVSGSSPPYLVDLALSLGGANTLGDLDGVQTTETRLALKGESLVTRSGVRDAQLGQAYPVATLAFAREGSPADFSSGTDAFIFSQGVLGRLERSGLASVPLSVAKHGSLADSLVLTANFAASVPALGSWDVVVEFPEDAGASIVTDNTLEIARTLDPLEPLAFSVSASSAFLFQSENATAVTASLNGDAEFATLAGTSTEVVRVRCRKSVGGAETDPDFTGADLALVQSATLVLSDADGGADVGSFAMQAAALGAGTAEERATLSLSVSPWPHLPAVGSYRVSLQFAGGSPAFDVLADRAAGTPFALQVALDDSAFDGVPQQASAAVGGSSKVDKFVSVLPDGGELYIVGTLEVTGMAPGTVPKGSGSSWDQAATPLVDAMLLASTANGASVVRRFATNGTSYAGVIADASSVDATATEFGLFLRTALTEQVLVSPASEMHAYAGFALDEHYTGAANAAHASGFVHTSSQLAAEGLVAVATGSNGLDPAASFEFGSRAFGAPYEEADVASGRDQRGRKYALTWTSGPLAGQSIRVRQHRPGAPSLLLMPNDGDLFGRGGDSFVPSGSVPPAGSSFVVREVAYAKAEPLPVQPPTVQPAVAVPALAYSQSNNRAQRSRQAILPNDPTEVHWYPAMEATHGNTVLEMQFDLSDGVPPYSVTVFWDEGIDPVQPFDVSEGGDANRTSWEVRWNSPYFGDSPGKVRYENVRVIANDSAGHFNEFVLNLTRHATDPDFMLLWYNGTNDDGDGSAQHPVRPVVADQGRWFLRQLNPPTLGLGGSTGVSADPSQIVLDSGTASASDRDYSGAVLTLLAGGGGETRVISSYDGASRTATVSPAFSSLPSSGTPYQIDHIVAAVYQLGGDPDVALTGSLALPSGSALRAIASPSSAQQVYLVRDRAAVPEASLPNYDQQWTRSNFYHDQNGYRWPVHANANNLDASSDPFVLGAENAVRLTGYVPVAPETLDAHWFDAAQPGAPPYAAQPDVEAARFADYCVAVLPEGQTSTTAAGETSVGATSPDGLQYFVSASGGLALTNSTANAFDDMDTASLHAAGVTATLPKLTSQPAAGRYAGVALRVRDAATLDEATVPVSEADFFGPLEGVPVAGTAASDAELALTASPHGGDAALAFGSGAQWVFAEILQDSVVAQRLLLSLDDLTDGGHPGIGSGPGFRASVTARIDLQTGARDAAGPFPLSFTYDGVASQGSPDPSMVRLQIDPSMNGVTGSPDPDAVSGLYEVTVWDGYTDVGGVTGAGGVVLVGFVGVVVFRKPTFQWNPPFEPFVVLQNESPLQTVTDVPDNSYTGYLFGDRPAVALSVSGGAGQNEVTAEFVGDTTGTLLDARVTNDGSQEQNYTYTLEASVAALEFLFPTSPFSATADAQLPAGGPQTARTLAGAQSPIDTTTISYNTGNHPNWPLHDKRTVANVIGDLNQTALTAFVVASTSNTVTFSAQASTSNGAYVGSTVVPAVGLPRVVTAYDGTTRTATASAEWTAALVPSAPISVQDYVDFSPSDDALFFETNVGSFVAENRVIVLQVADGAPTWDPSQFPHGDNTGADFLADVASALNGVDWSTVSNTSDVAVYGTANESLVVGDLQGKRVVFSDPLSDQSAPSAYAGPGATQIALAANEGGSITGTANELVVVFDAANGNQSDVRVVSSYNATTRVVTVTEPFTVLGASSYVVYEGDGAALRVDPLSEALGFRVRDPAASMPEYPFYLAVLMTKLGPLDTDVTVKHRVLQWTSAGLVTACSLSADLTRCFADSIALEVSVTTTEAFDVPLNWKLEQSPATGGDAWTTSETFHGAPLDFSASNYGHRPEVIRAFCGALPHTTQIGTAAAQGSTLLKYRLTARRHLLRLSNGNSVFVHYGNNSRAVTSPEFTCPPRPATTSPTFFYAVAVGPTLRRSLSFDLNNVALLARDSLDADRYRVSEYEVGGDRFVDGAPLRVVTDSTREAYEAVAVNDENVYVRAAQAVRVVLPPARMFAGRNVYVHTGSSARTGDVTIESSPDASPGQGSSPTLNETNGSTVLDGPLQTRRAFSVNNGGTWEWNIYELQ